MRSALIGALAGALLLATAGPAGATTTFTVTTTADSGAGSLRQAILDANATPGTDAIAFADLGATPKIAPLTPLPEVIDSVTIDGYTHPGAAVNTAALGDNAVIKVELSGENLGGTAVGLLVTAGGSTVRGLVINRFPGTAILIGFSGGNVIEGNYIGTDRTGLTAAANGSGVDIVDADGNVIGGATPAARNVIAGNAGNGLSLGGANSIFNDINGNYVGVAKTGLAALPNGADAIDVNGVDDAEIGTGGAAGRNVIVAGPNQTAIRIRSPAAERTQVRGNYIGVNRSAGAVLGGAFANISVEDAHDTVIGGTVAGSGNVIGGALGYGVILHSGTPTKVQGNRIGNNGTVALRNSHGINVQEPGGDLIGGTDPGARNVISGNDEGIVAFGANLTIQGNFIGTTATGNAPLPNTADGIFAQSDHILVGGDTVSARNVIAGNTRFGVLYSAAADAKIRGNHIGIGANGLTAVGNGTGVWIEGGAAQVDIGGFASTPGAPPGNVISGNFGTGIAIRSATVGTIPIMSGNLIGTNAAGTAAVGNGGDGVSIRSGARAVVGDFVPNVISGNEMAGVYIANSSDSVVRRNYIGLNRAGTAAVPNRTGVELAGGATRNAIGRDFEGNTISGNRYEGVFVHGGGAADNTVAGNLIGTRADGAAAVPNRTGVVISGGAQENTLGEPFNFGRGGNTISGNTAEGVLITGAETNRNLLYGGVVGLNRAGTGALPNGIGVTIAGGARDNTVESSTVSGNKADGVSITGASTFGNRVLTSNIGTTATGAAMGNRTGVHVWGGAAATTLRANRIARNSGIGVLVDGGTTAGAELIANRIFGNGGLGINLWPTGEAANAVTPNDAGDADAGPNRLQNFPLVGTASGTSAGTTVSGTLNSRPGERYRIEVFRRGSGEEVFAASTVVTTGATGSATWTVTFAGDHSGEVVRATATRLTTRDTSEFSTTKVVG